MLAKKRGQNGLPLEGQPKTLTELLGSSQADQETQKRLVPLIKSDWSGGFGIDYTEAPGCYTRTPGYVLPAGQAISTTLDASGNSTSPVLALEEFGSDLWFGQSGASLVNEARVMRSISKTGPPANSLQLAANRYLRDLIVFDNGSGTRMLYASSSDVSPFGAGLNGVLSRFDPGAGTWSSTTAGVTFGTNGRNRMAQAFWRTPDGNGGQRLITISGKYTIAYTVPDSDPFLAASWVEGVKIGTNTGLLSLVATRRHVYCLANDGVYDLDEGGNSPNLVSYWGQMQHANNGIAGVYLDGYIYASLGTGLDRIYVGDGPLLQENPGQCAPGWGTRAESQWRGSITCLAVDQGYLLAAVYNPTTFKSAIFYGKDRRTLGVETPNPLAWFGPEIIIDGDYVIRAMRPVSSGNGLNLWVTAVPLVTPGNPIAFAVSIPVAGAPLQDLLSTGLHRFNDGDGYLFGETIQAYSRLTMLEEDGGDPVAPMVVYQHGVAARGLEGSLSTTRLYLDTRVDSTPGDTAWTTSDAVITSPVQTVTPTLALKGNRLERRIQFHSPSGASTPPKVGVLDAVRTMAWVIAPVSITTTLDVEYGPGILTLDGLDEGTMPTRDPNVITSELVALMEVARTTLRERDGRRWQIKLHQILALEQTLDESDYGKSIQASIEIVKLAAL